MNTNTNKLNALAKALDYAGLTRSEVNVDKLIVSGDGLGVCYEIEFTTECLHYYCYVDVNNGEVLGFMTVPAEPGVCITSAA